MMPNYKAISIFYDLIDVVYFNRKNHSPRTAIVKTIPDTQCNVLDVCAGTCSNSILIAKNKPKAKIIALDMSAEMLGVAEKKFKKLSISNIDTTVSDACKTGFPDNSFDVILISLVLHEISEDMRNSLLNEAVRLLSNDGRIIIVEWEQPAKPFQQLLFFPIKSMEPAGFEEFLRSDLPYRFTKLGLTVHEKRSCDYTQIFTLIKLNEK